MSKRKIVAFLIDYNNIKYKIEHVYEEFNAFSSTATYNILFEDGCLKYKNFNSKNEALRYLEEHVGSCTEY